MADRTNGLNNIDIGSGRRGFRNRNLGLGQAGTVVDAEWANGIQEEIVRLIEQLGVSPSAANREQVLQAVRRLAAGNTTGFSASTALTADHAGLVLASAASGAVVLTLPAANAAGGAPLRLSIARTDGSVNALTIQRAGSDTINGLTTSITLPVNGAVSLVSDGGSAWRIVGTAGLVQTDVFTASGTATAPIWARGYRVRAWAGGGGGGAAFNSVNSIGSGGGAGEYGERTGTIAPGTAVTVTIGSGGAGGLPATPTSGGNGTATSFGSLLTVAGGGGGIAANGSAQSTVGSGGTTTPDGLFRRPGRPGGVGYQGGAGYIQAAGGGAFGAGGTETATGGTITNGITGIFPGGGGAGSTVGGNAGAGAPGLVIVEWLP